MFVLLLCSSLAVASPMSEAGPSLAGFDDLFKLANQPDDTFSTRFGQWGDGGRASFGEVGRDDRSLTNTYPFNQVANQPQQHHNNYQPADHLRSAAPQHHQTASSHHQTVATHHQATPSHHQASATHHQIAAPQTLAVRNQIANQFQSHQRAVGQRQAAANQFQHFSPRQGSQSVFQPRNQYNLLPGFGPGITSQYEHAAAAPVAVAHHAAAAGVAHHSAGYEVGDYAVVESALAAAPGPVIAARVASLAHIPRVIANSCPAPNVLPGQCHGQQNQCWSVGVPDVDCPGNAYCCFNGCSNVCLGSAPIIPQVPRVRPVIPQVVHPINPNRARRPAGPVVDLNIVAEAAERCVDKIELVEETEYEDTIECNHSYDKKCHTSYVTEYDSQQEEECNDNYRKKCDITYSPSAYNQTVEVCTRPLVKDCNLSGPEVCRTEYVSECWTRNNAHVVVDDVANCQTVYEEKCHQKQEGYTTREECSKWPKNVCNVVKKQNKKYNPETKCEKIPQTLCGPSGCGFVQGAPQCHDTVKTIVTDLPEETCNLEPSRNCEHVTKLVPKLVPVEECVDVPKETCHKTQVPHKVVREVTKKWCYKPSVESGLH